MLRKGILIALMVLPLTAAIMLSGAGASAPFRADLVQPTSDPELLDLDFGDAPEGGLAYPAFGVPGQFPTCQFIGPAGSVQHTNFGAFFGSLVDFEADGNAGLCGSAACFPPYDQDECFRDLNGDAGLLFPEPFTIDAALSVLPCPNSLGTPLGDVCQFASWGANVDIYVTNNMPNGTIGYANLLVDWNMDGQWGGSMGCPAYPGIAAPEHALVNFPVPNPSPNGYSGRLSQLFPPNFLIGPKAGYAWARFTISEQQVPANWDGSGAFEDGESEDYLLQIADADPGIKWSQLPNRTLSGLHAHDDSQWSLTLADDWLCQGGEVTDLHWWGNYELDAAQNERRGAGIASFHLSIHAPDPQNPCLPLEPAMWPANVPFGMVSETDTGLVNNEGSKIYKYTYVLPQPFPQTAGGTYWFDISAISQDITDPPMWRWQESARATNPAFPPNYCGAAMNQTPPGGWGRVIWSDVPPRYSEMAFEVTSAMEEPENDLGDAPDSSNTWGTAMTAYTAVPAPALFPTVYQAGSPPYGPIHWLPQGVAWLGPAVTSENEADVGPDQDPANNITPQVNVADLDGADDGVGLPLRLPNCVSTTFTYTVNVVTPPLNPLYVNVWFDWWRDGEWDDTAPCPQAYAPEWAVQNQVLAAGTPAGLHVITSPAFLPYNPLPMEPNPLWMRITLSEQQWSPGSGGFGDGGSGPQSGYQYGETEDYYIESYLGAQDWGDAPDRPYPTLAPLGATHLITSQGPWLGALIDAEPDGQPSSLANGDDLAGLADEDGVIFTTPLLPGQTACVDVTAASPTGGQVFLDGWIDYNSDGIWLMGLPEQIFASQALSPGLNSGLCFAVPAGAFSGFTYARFRLSSLATGLPPSGPAPDGEVEDYRVYVEAIKWSQPPVLNPGPPACYWGWDELSLYEGQQIVADDWLCEDERQVTDIHWWGSYDEWVEQVPPPIAPVMFHLGIWTDVPAAPGQFSHPGRMIWEYLAPYPAVHERPAGCDFHPGMMQFPDTCFEYHVDLPEAAWFRQEPGGHIYWLSVAAIYPVPPGEPVPYPWGWKTRPHFFNDDAVRIFAPTAPHPGSIYEFGEPIMLGTESWDLAFVLTTQAYDFGDAADPPYSTLLANAGARHVQTATGPFMGRYVDADPDGQPSLWADGDDISGLDDEDGVAFQTALVPGQSGSVLVDLTISPVGCTINGWIDFNHDGVWDNTAGSVERIATDLWALGGYAMTVSFPVPPWPISSVGMTTARFRCASATGLGPTGSAADGEVEDYRVEIIAPPRRPQVSIAISGTTGVLLSWPQVTLDIYGNAITADGYHIYRATAPYAMWGPAASLWGVVADPVTWDDPNKVGDPTVNYYYTVDTVLRDINGFEVYSVRSNEVAEFDFALTPGSP